MNFAEKLKNARKMTGMSQEALAEKLGVSRQAVTKWETERGIPDIENMMILSKLFGISVDEFLSKEKTAVVQTGYRYESKTEYDMDEVKRLDIKLGGASNLTITGTDGEKVLVKLASNAINTLERDFKVRIDDIKQRLDIDVNRKNGMTEAKAKDNLSIEFFLPNRYLSHVELDVNCEKICVRNLICERVEFHGKINTLYLKSVEAIFEVDSNLDMAIEIADFKGSLEINQVSSTSRLTVPTDFSFRNVVKGFFTSVFYESKGETVENFSDADGENVIELNGIKSELVICCKDERNG